MRRECMIYTNVKIVNKYWSLFIKITNKYLFVNLTLKQPNQMARMLKLQFTRTLLSLVYHNIIVSRCFSRTRKHFPENSEGRIPMQVL